MTGRAEIMDATHAGGLGGTYGGNPIACAAALAAIDVFDEEPLPADDPLRSAPRVLLTPHRAAGTREGRLRQGRIVADELDAFVAGVPLAHTIDRAQLSSMA